MLEIKPGQIWQQENGEIFVLTLAEDENVYVVYLDGYSTSYSGEEDNYFFIFDKLIAEYPTWQEAVNSPEFRGEK